jgi:hypothetical protein
MIRIYSRNSSRFMQQIIYPLVAVILFSALGACKKINFEGSPGVLAIFNSLDNQVNLYTNFSGSQDFQYRTAKLIQNNQFQPNQNRITLNKNPQSLALYASTDTLPKDAPVLNLELDINAGDIYSLFVYGSKEDAKHLLLKESIPGVLEKDSLTWVRFINLSGYPHISLNIAGNTPGSLVSDLPFEQNTAFIHLDANHAVNNYVFEVRDKNTGDLLFAYSTDKINDYKNLFNPWFNKPNTLVFAGKPGGTGTNAPKLYLMANR